VIAIGVRAAQPGTRIVYLDQNHWVSLAQYRYSPERLRTEEHEAAAAISEFATRGDVVLPLSGAHAVETARSDGRWRRTLATTMLRLSRGWQMLSPVKARRVELASDMMELAPGAQARDALFTLEPGALFTARPAPQSEGFDEFPAPARELIRRLTWASAFAEMLLEDQITDEQRGRELAEKWAQLHGRLAEFMRFERTPREHVRLNAHAAVLADLRDDIAAAAAIAHLAADDFERWLEGVGDDLRRLPYVGRLEELVYHRLRDATAPWQPNDLNDVHFLCCAAGYADVVICEKKTADHLRRAARRATPGAVICASLAAGWHALESSRN
jgi:hypothetical protein